MRYFLDPFGCAKNQVDAENMMSSLNHSGWQSSEAGDADLIIINTCGFIESAKQESINAVLAWRKLYPQKKILVAGCLAQRYKNELEQALPEADTFFGIEDLSGIVKVAQQMVPGTFLAGDRPLVGDRPLLSLPGSAYVKISEGCNNRCSYCAIPLIRGSLSSRNISEIRDECKTLVDRGIKELCIIAQDIAAFGTDSGKSALPELLEEISRLSGEFWVRLLYIHPDHFPLPILDIMKQDTRFLPYFDLPFQHGSEKILRLMNRTGNAEKYLSLISTIRQSFPDAVLRSTFMTGFPGETDEDFQALMDFQNKAALDWAGCFAYSREEDTPAFSMKPKVGKKITLQRKQILEENQVAITERQMDRFVGRDFQVLVEEKVQGEEGLWIGRLFCQSPDIDGATVINCDTELELGSLVKGRVVRRAGFDLEVTV